MQKEVMVEDVEKMLNEDNINDTVLVKRKNKADVVIMNLEEYKKIFEMNFIARLKKGEEQIKNGEVTDATLVFEEMKAKYEY